MSTTSKTIWVIVILLVIAGVVWFGYSYTKNSGSDDTSVRQTVTSLGKAEQQVSLLAPDASTEIAKAYSAYVSPALLTAWEQNPATAPGRQTSSPWPDHIDIATVTNTASNVYTVTGSVVLVTSDDSATGGNAGTIPVSMTVEKTNGTWLVTAYSQGTATSPSVTGTNPTTGINPTTPGQQTYTHQSPNFSFVYGSPFTISNGAPGGQDSTYWSQLATAAQTGTTYVTLSLPQSVDPKTNFGDARLTVGRSTNASAVSTCLTASTGNPSTTTVTTIHGVQYTIITTSDAGAGNLYTTTSYRTVNNGACYAIEYTIHTSNIQNYPPGTVTAYDESMIKKLLTDVVGSFAFGPMPVQVQ